MNFDEIYSFIFGTPAGVGILIAATLVICIIVAFILEGRTRKVYADRGQREDGDEWSLFDDEEDED